MLKFPTVFVSWSCSLLVCLLQLKIEDAWSSGQLNISFAVSMATALATQLWKGHEQISIWFPLGAKWFIAIVSISWMSNFDTFHLQLLWTLPNRDYNTKQLLSLKPRVTLQRPKVWDLSRQSLWSQGSQGQTPSCDPAQVLLWQGIAQSFLTIWKRHSACQRLRAK